MANIDAFVQSYFLFSYYLPRTFPSVPLVFTGIFLVLSLLCSSITPNHI